MKKQNLLLIFMIIVMSLLFISALALVIFSFINIDNNFYNAINVAALLISFASFAASCFFSLAVYIQAKNQEKINEKLPKKDDQYILNNYSLIDFCKEITLLSNGKTSRLVFLVTDTINQPVYKVRCKSISIGENSDKKSINFDIPFDCNYAKNVLDRNYNCIYVDLPLSTKEAFESINGNKIINITLQIISTFNVAFELNFVLTLDSLKDTSHNEDKKKFDFLETWLLHHSVFNIIDKKIVDIKDL